VKRQAKSYWCGLASIANALEVLGIRRSQREIDRLCHVSPEAGCDEVEMKRALLANGCDVDEWPGIDCDTALRWVDGCMGDGMPVILCVDDDEHWVTVIGTCGPRYIVFDPSRNAGIEVHSPPSLAARWVNAAGDYYGLGVSLKAKGPPG
jgi:ABC-type bacteriocin/lantibiotic exporter with double-glycine peptidase domain